MKSSARSLFFAPFGTTQRLPPEPGANLLPGKRKVPHLNFVISVMNRPYHHEPETMIGAVPLVNATPISSAFMLTDSLPMSPPRGNRSVREWSSVARRAA